MIITPHVGGQAATRIDDMTNFFCDNLAATSPAGRCATSSTSDLGFPLARASIELKPVCASINVPNVTGNSSRTGTQNRLDVLVL